MHKLLAGRPGEKILVLGNESIARGAIEAGVAFATTYPRDTIVGNFSESFSDQPGE